MGQPRGQVFSVPEGLVQNGRFEETELGIIEVTYDLVSSALGATFAIELFVSEDGQDFVRATSVTGDVGSGVQPGPGKRITWRWTQDIESLAPQLDRFRFQVRTESAALRPDTPTLGGAPEISDDSGGISPWVWVGVAAGGAIGAVAALGGGGGRTSSSTTTTTTASSTTTTTAPVSRCNFSLSRTSVDVGASGGSPQVRVTVSPSGCSPNTWTATSRVGWITVSPVDGRGNNTVTLRIAANSSTSVRNGTVEIAGKNVSVNQARTVGACRYLFSGNALTAKAVGGGATTRTLNIDTDSHCDWTVSGVHWIDPNPGSGKGSDTVLLHFGDNPLPFPQYRMGSVTVAGDTFEFCQQPIGPLGHPYDKVFPCP